jgi:hypothetical protein
VLETKELEKKRGWEGEGDNVVGKGCTEQIFSIPTLTTIYCSCEMTEDVMTASTLSTVSEDSELCDRENRFVI